MVETKKIPFEGSELLGIKDDSEKLWLAIRNVCYDLGFSDGQIRRQVENIRKDIVLSKGVANLRYPSDGGEQETLCIIEDYVTLWLAKISLTPKMKESNPDGVKKTYFISVKSKRCSCVSILKETRTCNSPTIKYFTVGTSWNERLHRKLSCT